MAIGGVCGGMIAAVSLDRDVGFGEYMLTLLGLLMCLAVVMWIHVTLHETGHLVFGLLTGYRFSSFRSGSLMLVKEGDKLRLRRLKVPGTSGQCLLIPPEPVDGKIPYALYGMGGVIVNVSLSLVALIAWLLLPKDNFWSVVLLMGVLVGFALALANGLPLPAGIVNNDGRNTLTLKKCPRAMEHYIHQLQINAALSHGLRVKEMPVELFPIPAAADMGDCFTATAGLFAANRLLDEHRVEQTQALLEQLLAGEADLMGLHRGMATCDLIFCETLGQNRPEKLEALLTKEQFRYMQMLKKSISAIRTEYALAKLRDRDEEKARKLLDQFEKVAKIYPYPQEVQSERELLAMVEEKAHGETA